MFAGFDLKVDLSSYDAWYAFGKELHESNKGIVSARLDSFKDEDGGLIAERIVSEWFPSVRADIFLSHSHRDERGVIALSGWLNKKFGLRCFIDSAIWGYSNDLLRMIDDEYCYDTKNKIYRYSDRNKSTGHVHMMLSTALSKTMDSCESVFFVNTPNSLSLADSIKASGTTESPWIFSEISMTKLLRQRTPHDHRRIIAEAMDSAGLESLEKSFTVNYKVDLRHLTKLNKSLLDVWYLNYLAKNSSDALDVLYEQHNLGVIYGL